MKNEHVTDISQTVWEVPSDYTEEQETLLTELCINGQLGYQDALTCVRSLLT
jgi:hypothetical protein